MQIHGALVHELLSRPDNDPTHILSPFVESSALIKHGGAYWAEGLLRVNVPNSTS
jgi:hypothetical protein